MLRSALAHAGVALVALAVAAVAFRGSLAEVGTSLDDPYVVRAAAFYLLAAAALGAATVRWCRHEAVSTRVGRAVAVGVAVHPLALVAFALSARAVPFDGLASTGTIMEDVRSALGFSVGAVLFGAWFAIPAAWLAGELTRYART